MIQLGQPWALLALASIPAVLVLYSLRPVRRRLAISTTVLWREVLRERQRGLGLQKLWRDLSLLLLLLFALLVSAGLADPRWVTQVAERGDVVLVLDVSASMKAGGGAEPRFERARRAAEAVIDAEARGGRVLLMSSGRIPVVRTGFETDPDALHRALDELVPTDEAGRPREALSLALSMLRNHENGRVVFVTDRAFDESIDFLTPRIELVDVGGPARNVAITRFDIRREIGARDRLQLLLTVRNYTDAAVLVPATMSLDDRVLVEQELAIAAGAHETLVLPLRGRTRGRAYATIAFDDDLDADDHAYAMLREESLRVLLITPGNFYLESVLGALPNVFFTRMDEVWSDRFETQARLHDLVVIDRIQAPRLPPGRYLLIDTVPPGLPFVSAGTVTRPTVSGVGGSPMVRFVDLTGLRIDAAQRIEVQGSPPGLQRLFWSSATDIALALLEDERRIVYLGFDLSHSNLPVLAAFPLLIGQAVEWLRAREGGTPSTQTAAGEPHAIEVPVGTGEIAVGTPANRWRRFPVRGGALVFEGTDQAGFYPVRIRNEIEYFAVNLTDAAESDLRPRAPARSPAAAAAPGATRSPTSMPLWPYLIGGALAVLVLEWALWCAGRRFA